MLLTFSRSIADCGCFAVNTSQGILGMEIRRAMNDNGVFGPQRPGASAAAGLACAGFDSEGCMPEVLRCPPSSLPNAPWIGTAHS